MYFNVHAVKLLSKRLKVAITWLVSSANMSGVGCVRNCTPGIIVARGNLVDKI